MKTLVDLQTCGKKKRAHVKSAESCQKEEAKVRFVNTSKKRKADDEAKPEVKPADEQGTGSSGKKKNKRKYFRDKKAKQN
jgi:hypothetical protein